MDGNLNPRLEKYQGELDTSRPDSAEICSVCQKIANAVIVANNGPAPQTELRVGTWQEFLDRRQCICCQRIVQCLKERNPSTIMFEPSCLLEFSDMNDCFWLTADSLNDPHRAGEPEFLDHPLLKLIPTEICGEKVPRHITVDPAYIDIARLVAWSTYCDQHHQGSCHDLPQWQIIPPASSLIFVDVQDYCLVQVSDYMSHRYVTLSYVWGQILGSIELKRQNLSHLCVRNSLKLPDYWLRMPKTILDAMALTDAMGLRYLWVDRLCIIQDEPTHLTKQLQQMAQIYGNSHFTIIAADGSDADYGLHGVNPSFSPRSFVELPFEFAMNIKMVQKPEQESGWKEPFWHTRAWTFQERAVSRRTLVFTNNTVYWQCRSAVWYENFAADPEGFLSPRWYSNSPSIGWPSYSLNVNPWPDIAQYFDLVSGYNNRNLSFERDALRAFAAITTAMSKSFPGGFYFGLPIFLFDLGMLWSGRTPLQRRNSFPSWSWLGWAGRVNLPFGYKRSWDPIFAHYEVEGNIKPLTNWYSIRGNEGFRHLIDNSYSRYKVDLQDPDLSLPEGWNRAWNEEHHVEAVQHESLPNHLFKFPFPIFPAMMEDITEYSSPYLEFEAESCTLLLDTSYASGFESEPLLAVDLRDDRGCWAGVIESLFVRQDEYKFGTPCECIAISEGRANRDKDDDPIQSFDEMDRVQEIENLEDYGFYNVLWIEWAA